jgi:hypothetical protein
MLGVGIPRIISRSHPLAPIVDEVLARPPSAVVAPVHLGFALMM